MPSVPDWNASTENFTGNISTHKRYKVFSYASDTIIEIIDFNMKLIRIYNFLGIMKDDELQHKHEDNTNLFIAEFNTIQ